MSEVKCEAVFGDQSLFDGASEFVEVIRFNDYSRDYLWGDLNTIQLLTFEELKATPIVAMRRIIRTPTWTTADQKAGKLPEVGMIGALKNGREIEYLGKSVGGTLHHVRFVDDGECIRISLFDFFPIESPEEKAEREEDEFVGSMCRPNEPCSTLYIDGIRAAYRKLKGGE